jgi:sodium/hydrogen antiporter
VIVTFGVFGTLLPWSGWVQLGWAGLLFALWVLLLRRPPVVGMALMSTRTGLLSRAYLAWFGPVGVAGIYYLAHVEQYGLAQYDRLHAAGSLAICVSVLAHTLTSTPAVHAHGRRAGTEHPQSEPSESGGPLP